MGEALLCTSELKEYMYTDRVARVFRQTVLFKQKRKIHNISDNNLNVIYLYKI